MIKHVGSYRPLTVVFAVALVLTSYFTGSSVAKRAEIMGSAEIAHSEIVVTEILLAEYLSACNKPGYRRLSTFHEHNIDNVIRKLEYGAGFPYFLPSVFVAKAKKLYLNHKARHTEFKSQFLEECGEA